MELYEAIEKRRTIRVYKQAATPEQLRRILLAGTKSASAGNRQPWEFIYVDDPEIIDQIAEHKYQQNRSLSPSRYGPGTTQKDVDEKSMRQRKAYQNCSVIPVCCKANPELAVSTWMCIENAALAATAEGLGSVTSSFWDEHQKGVEQLLGIPEGYELITVMLIGVPGEEVLPRDGNPYSPRRPDFSWLHKNKFGVPYTL